MIRFCDSDVKCVEYSSLDRSELLSYFLSGHSDEIVYVCDDSNEKNFFGIITHYSLLHATTIDGAIQKEYVILDDNIWRNAREIYKKISRDVWKNTILPVLNRENQLICFAYQDEEANREIRMLRELKETQEVLQFSDVFEEYKCVKIHEFNELAYFFAEYLRNQNILVQVEGMMWKDFFVNEECKMPEYECLNIYAEGTWEKTRNWRENLLRSVSVEFECIDKIYEANIKSNLIKDAGEEACELLEHLRGEKEVILFGRGRNAQDAYDFLTKNGIEVCCFVVVDQLPDRYMHRLFGKKILNLQEVICTYRNPVFIDCGMKHSAWGLGQVDYFDYIGYSRNERFVMLRDYIEVPQNNLLNALRTEEVVLTGDRYLCDRLYEYLKGKKISVIGYLRIFQEDFQPANIPELSIDVVNEDTICIIVVPAYYSDAQNAWVGMEELRQRMAYLRGKNIDNFIDYFCDMSSFINVEKDNDIKYKSTCLMPKRIVFGSIEYCNGNIFFRALLDSHPSILYLDYCGLNTQLFWICVRLSTECAENILPLFWKLMETNDKSITNKPAFTEKMEQLLAHGSRFTSQELFIMFHIAYAHMLGRDVPEDNIRDMVIYWEPHFMNRDRLEECAKWLMAEEMRCDIINVVRNSVPQKGTRLKAWTLVGGVKGAYTSALRRLAIDQKNMSGVDRLIVKFEDLKCNPRETLQEICCKWNVSWSDTLMHTTRGGQEHVYSDDLQTVGDFDLRPVYNTYENFFSEFDRFRIMLIDAPYQKKYGYPYVEPDRFARRELQEMFLKEFRFESPGDTTGFYKGHLELDDRIALQNDLRRRIQETRCLLYAL